MAGVGPAVGSGDRCGSAGVAGTGLVAQPEDLPGSEGVATAGPAAGTEFGRSCPLGAGAGRWRLWGIVAPHRGVNDLRVTRKGLSVIPLGYPTYLATKVKGESSMLGKVGCREAIKRQAHRDPDGMVKATLPEPKCPFCKPHGLDTMANIQCFWEGPNPDSSAVIRSLETGLASPTSRTRTGHLNRPGTSFAIRNAGSPKGREPHGDRASVVVRGRESRPHGEGRPVDRSGREPGR